MGTTLVDEDNVNEAPESSYNILVCESDVNVNLDEIDSNLPKLVNMIDVLGRTQIEHSEGQLLLYIYDDGKITKNFKY